MNRIRLPVDGYAHSTLQMYSEPGIVDHDDPDDADIAAVIAAYNGKSLRFEPQQAEQIARGLTDLSNTEDEDCERRKKERHPDPEGIRFCRAASLGLSTLAMHAHRAGRAA